MNSPLNKDEILKEFKKFMINVWKEWDRIDGDWRPRWDHKYEEEMGKIAKRCKGNGEIKVYNWCRIQMNYIFYEKWTTVQGRLFYAEDLTRNKRDWITQVNQYFKKEWYQWNAVTRPQIRRMERILSSEKGWDKEDSEEWEAECFATGKWIDPEGWIEKRG